ncbi:MAG TPA: DUF3147 family protein [Solirubrobacteraceae bacterium]|jgi:hypothetical protein|nr:DUF3147 family protein [Solirubrobacteraceae bacterium]
MSVTGHPREQPEHREQTISERVTQRPSFNPRRVLKVRRRDLLVRFVAGGVTSIVSGAVTLAFGPRIGGILLAFPAILGASMTLIEEQEDSEEAREDARGAIGGACGLTVFAIVAALTFGHVGGGLALLLAAVGWAVIAFGLYVALWYR